jgi:hypothetical protein
MNDAICSNAGGGSVVTHTRETEDVRRFLKTLGGCIGGPGALAGRRDERGRNRYPPMPSLVSAAPFPNHRRVGLTPPEPPTSQCAFLVPDQPAAGLDHPPATAALLPFPDRVSNRRGYPFGLGDVVSKQGIGRQDRRQTRLAIPSAN